MGMKNGKIIASVNTTVISNTDQIIVQINEDRLKLKLNDFKNKINASRNWSIPLGFFVSFFQSFFTAEFKSIFGLSKENVYSIFIILTIIFGGWFVISGIQSIISFFKKDTSIEKLIFKIKSEV